MTEDGATTPQQQRRRSLNRKILIGTGIIFALLIVIGVAVGDDSSDETTAV